MPSCFTLRSIMLLVLFRSLALCFFTKRKTNSRGIELGVGCEDRVLLQGYFMDTDGHTELKVTFKKNNEV